MLQWVFAESFRDSFQSLPLDIQESIKGKLGYYQSCEQPLTFAKKLKGYKDIYRFRIGHYRAVFRFSRGILFFIIVKHRKEVYRGLS